MLLPSRMMLSKVLLVYNAIYNFSSYFTGQSRVSRWTKRRLPVSESINVMNQINFSSDTDLAAKCIVECEAAYVECVGNCTDTDCLLDCGREIAFCENCMSSFI